MIAPRDRHRHAVGLIPGPSPVLPCPNCAPVSSHHPCLLRWLNCLLVILVAASNLILTNFELAIQCAPGATKQTHTGIIIHNRKWKVCRSVSARRTTIYTMHILGLAQCRLFTCLRLWLISCNISCSDSVISLLLSVFALFRAST